jgi:hypothetical protein
MMPMESVASNVPYLCLRPVSVGPKRVAASDRVIQAIEAVQMIRDGQVLGSREGTCAGKPEYLPFCSGISRVHRSRAASANADNFAKANWPHRHRAAILDILVKYREILGRQQPLEL